MQPLLVYRTPNQRIALSHILWIHAYIHMYDVCMYPEQGWKIVCALHFPARESRKWNGSWLPTLTEKKFRQIYIWGCCPYWLKKNSAWLCLEVRYDFWSNPARAVPSTVLDNTTSLPKQQSYEDWTEVIFSIVQWINHFLPLHLPYC